MNTNIRSKRADEVWLAVALATIQRGDEGTRYSPGLADVVTNDWAARFGTEDDLADIADIEANKARREMGGGV